MESNDRLITKPKEKGLSFVINEDQTIFDINTNNGEQAVIVARSKRKAKNIAESHYGKRQFKIYKKVFKGNKLSF